MSKEIMFIVYTYTRGNMTGHTKFETLAEANEYAELISSRGYKVVVVDKTKKIVSEM